MLRTDKDHPITVRRPNRHWLRFSLRTLLLATTLFCIWLGLKVNAARRQHEAVEAILKAGGEVVYDFQMFPEGSSRELLLDPNAKAKEPVWLLNWIGLDYLHDVTGVVLGPERPIPRSDVARLTSLPRLKRLQFAGTKVILPDGHSQFIQTADLASLGTFPLLRGLMIERAEIDGACVHGLAPHVKGLSLANSHVDDAGMEQIGKLGDLEFLRRANTLITDAGMKHLRVLRKLNTLDIRGTAISDEGIQEIGNLTSLKAVDFGDTHVTDAGLKTLAGLTSLSVIELANTHVTDNSIDYLASVPNLARANLKYTHFTPEGIQRLQTLRPQLKILTMPDQFQRLQFQPK